VTDELPGRSDTFEIVNFLLWFLSQKEEQSATYPKDCLPEKGEKLEPGNLDKTYLENN